MVCLGGTLGVQHLAEWRVLCVCVTRSQLELNSLGRGQHNLKRFVHSADEGPCQQAYLAAYLRQAGTHRHRQAHTQA